MEHFKLIHYYCTEHNRGLPDEFCKLIGSDMQTITGVRNIGQLTKNLNSMAHVGCFILDLETFTENKENEIIDGLIAIRAMLAMKTPRLLQDVIVTTGGGINTSQIYHVGMMAKSLIKTAK